jgi:hypothetical protein
MVRILSAVAIDAHYVAPPPLAAGAST